MRNKTDAFKGFARFSTELKLRLRMMKYLIKIVIILQIIIVATYLYRLHLPYTGAVLDFLYSLISKFLCFIPIVNELNLFSYSGTKLTPIEHANVFSNLYQFYIDHIYTSFLKSFYIWLLVPIFWFFFKLKSKSSLKEEHLRGTILVNDKVFSKKVKKEKKNTDVPINELINFPFDCENRHSFIVGRPGSGKTQFLSRVIKTVIDRDEKAIIYDIKGDFVAKFYNPKKDIILNPLDARSIHWNIFNEITSKSSLESICASMIPKSNNKADPFWANAARDVLYSCFYYLIVHNKKTNSAMHEISLKTREELLKLFKSTKGCERGTKAIEEERTGASVMSTFSQYTKSFDYLKQDYLFHGVFKPYDLIKKSEDIITDPSLDPNTLKAYRSYTYACLYYLKNKNSTTREALEVLCNKPTEDIINELSTINECKEGIESLIEHNLNPQALTHYVKLYYKTAFFAKKWIEDPSIKGRIFITNYSEISDVMKPIISLFIDICANKILMMKEDLNRRIFFFLDEFGTLQPLNNILNFLKLTRSYGGSAWIGVQEIGQIELIYGSHSTETIINGCGNSVIFGVNEPKTADMLSKKIGERETSKVDENYSYGTHEFRDGNSMSERKNRERVVLASDLMNLQDLHFYLKLATIPECTKSKIEYKYYPEENDKFIDAGLDVFSESYNIVPSLASLKRKKE